MTRPLVLSLVVAAAVVGIAVWAGGDDDQGAVPPPGPVPPASNAAPTAPQRAGRIVGFVRDVNGHPVAGASVAVTNGGRRARANRSGRFSLRVNAGRQTVVASHPGYTRQSVATTRRRGQGTRVDFSLAVTAPERISVPNSADRLIFWTGCQNLVRSSEQDLRGFIDRGVDGFVCQTAQLRGLGGTHHFTGDSRSQLRGPDDRLQRELRTSAVGRYAKEGKLLLYLGFFAANYFNTSTPLVDWFDDRGWAQKVLPRVQDLAAAARSMGFAGLAIDQELYSQAGGKDTASWSVRYPGNRHTEAQVRTRVKERGRQLMDSMVRAYPGLELLAYDTQIPEGWHQQVQEKVNQQGDALDSDVRIDFWDGISSIQGYSAIRWMDATFYKTPHIFGASWDTALQYNANRIYSYLSTRFSNWAYASSRLHLSPFSWVNDGPGSFEKARDPGYVAAQLDAFRRWGAGGTFANFAYGPVGEFDYGPYDAALRRASTPERVDTRPPELAISGPDGTSPRILAGATLSLAGTASDDFAIRAVRWYDDRGHEGVARLTWDATGDAQDGWDGEMTWSIADLTIPEDARRLTISAEDIHGLAREVQLPVTR